MVRIRFIEHNGTEHEVSAEPGYSLMEVAVQNGVAGIDADCGGSCACATCHVFVDEAWTGKLPPMEDMEDAMLSVSDDRQANSRLSCQVRISEDLDGLVVRTPEFQF